MVNWNLKLSQEAFFQSDNSYFKKLKLTLLGSYIEVLDLTNLLLTFFCWLELFDAKILLLLLRNNELTWAKSIKLIWCCNEEWLALKFFFKTLISDFLWWISSCNNFTWHCLYVKESDYYTWHCLYVKRVATNAKVKKITYDIAFSIP